MTPEVLARLERESLRAAYHWGPEAQMIKTCEELAELTVQLCKRVNKSPTTDAAIVDEIADVLIMVLQMRWRFRAADVDDRMAYKVERLARALDREALAQRPVAGPNDWFLPTTGDNDPPNK